MPSHSKALRPLGHNRLRGLLRLNAKKILTSSKKSWLRFQNRKSAELGSGNGPKPIGLRQTLREWENFIEGLRSFSRPGCRASLPVLPFPLERHFAPNNPAHCFLRCEKQKRPVGDFCARRTAVTTIDKGVVEPYASHRKKGDGMATTSTETQTWAHRMTEDSIIIGDGNRRFTIKSDPTLIGHRTDRGIGRKQRSTREERQWSDPTARRALHISQRRQRSMVYSTG